MLSRVAELQVKGQDDSATVNEHYAIWQIAKSQDSVEIYKALIAQRADADLQNSAPFIIMAPIPEYNAPAFDQKAFTGLITKFNKLAKGLSPMDRATALLPFVEAAGKSFAASAGNTKAAQIKADTAKGITVTKIAALYGVIGLPATERAITPQAATADFTTTKLADPASGDAGEPAATGNATLISGLLAAH
jgi:hypothetical protein